MRKYFRFLWQNLKTMAHDQPITLASIVSGGLLSAYFVHSDLSYKAEKFQEHQEAEFRKLMTRKYFKPLVKDSEIDFVLHDWKGVKPSRDEVSDMIADSYFSIFKHFEDLKKKVSVNTLEEDIIKFSSDEFKKTSNNSNDVPVHFEDKSKFMNNSFSKIKSLHNFREDLQLKNFKRNDKDDI